MEEKKETAANDIKEEDVAGLLNNIATKQQTFNRHLNEANLHEEVKTFELQDKELIIESGFATGSCFFTNVSYKMNKTHVELTETTAAGTKIAEGILNLKLTVFSVSGDIIQQYTRIMRNKMETPKDSVGLTSVVEYTNVQRDLSVDEQALACRTLRAKLKALQVSK